MQWYHNDKAILIGGRYKSLKHFDGTKQLFIMNPTKADDGRYSCHTVGSATTSKVEKTVNISDHITPNRRKKLIKATDVESKTDSTETPSENIGEDAKSSLNLKKGLKNITIGNGKNTKLICSIDGEPSSFEWLKDGKPLPRDPRYRITSDGGELSMELRNAMLADAGTYTCVAQGPKNTVTTISNLKIYSEINDDSRPKSFCSDLQGS